MQYVLKTANLTKQYKNTKALDDVSMTIKKGDIYGFVGENGAGKSTVIRLITGLGNPTSGSFELFEGATQEKLGRVAAVVETPALHLSMSAVGNLMFQCDLLGVVNKTEVIEKTLELVGLDYLKTVNKPAKSFSLGMKQRLGIAMALISDPEFIILDEPMNGLDPVGIIEMRELILKLNKEQGITILISSHILSELDKVATTYGFISHGRLLQEISADELHKSLNSYTRLVVKPLDKKVVAEVLKGHRYEIVEPDTIKIFDLKDDGSQLVKTFVNKDMMVSNVEKISTGIEDYYMSIIGGKKNV